MKSGTCSASTQAAKRVLLLEDDSAFRQIIEDFLTESGFLVTAVQSGVEGIQALLADDFDVILCDMLMPGLPGDLFYRAVERARPEACKRFIFMTGYRGNPNAGGFIEKVDCCALLKPFRLEDLLEKIHFLESRRQAASIQPIRIAAAVSSTRKAQHPSPSQNSTIDSARKSRSSLTSPDRQRGSETSRTGRRLPIRKPVLVSLIAALAGGLAIWLFQASITAASSELSDLEKKRGNLKYQSREFAAIKGQLETQIQQISRIRAEYNAPRWSPALRGIARSLEAGVQLRNFQAVGAQTSTDACNVRLEGTTLGPLPLLAANRFRKSLEEHLKQSFGQDRVTTHFDQLVETASSPLGEVGATFTLVVSIGSQMEPTPQPEDRP